MSLPGPSLPRTWRPVRARAVIHGIAVVVAVVMVMVALLLPADSGASLFDRLALVGTAVLVVSGLQVLARPRVTADDSGVDVVNLVRRRRLDYAEIVSLRLAPGDPWVYVDVSDGSTLAVMGIQAADGARAQAAARELAAAVHAHQPGDVGE